MTPRQLDLAHEFCERVGKADLLDYLELGADASSEDARAALKARRRKMQGMQSNPKFRDEARLLIRNFQALDAVLAEPSEHVRDMGRRRESNHLPILEMTIRGVLAGGPLTTEQEAYLRANARELGVSESSFDALLARLQAEPPGTPASARPRPISASPASARSTAATRTPAPPRSPRGADLREASGALGDLSAPYSPPHRTSPPPVNRGRSANRPEVSPEAPTVMDDPASGGRPPSVPPDLRSPDLRTADLRGVLPRVSKSTPPPQDRRARPDNPPSPLRTSPLLRPSPLTDAATAPPVRMRTASNSPPTEQTTAPRQVAPYLIGDDGGTLELASPSRVEVEVFGRRSETFEISVNLLGDLPVAARVSADDPWLTLTPTRLDPARRGHKITVTVHADRMFKDKDESSVRIFNDLGDQLVVAVMATRKVNWMPMLVGAAAVLGVLAVGMGGYLLFQQLMTPVHAKQLTIRIDPTSEAVFFDQKPVGSGPVVRMDKPPVGEHTITVVQPNFKASDQVITLAPDDDRILPIRLELTAPLDWEPNADDVRFELPDLTKVKQIQVDLQACAANTRQGTAPYQGTVKIHVMQDGRVGGVHIEPADRVPSEVQQCITRRAAVVSYPLLPADHDYAEVIATFEYP